MRDAVVDGGLGGVERGERIANQGLMARVGQESGFGAGTRVSGDVAENGGAQFGDAFAGEGGGADWLVAGWSPVSVRPRSALFSTTIADRFLI